MKVSKDELARLLMEEAHQRTIIMREAEKRLARKLRARFGVSEGGKPIVEEILIRPKKPHD